MALGKGKRRQDAQPRELDVPASMEGSMVFQEPVQLKISGRFQGTLKTLGSLTIGEKAQVDAEIHGEVITIAGTVRGKITAKQSLQVVPPAVVQGEIWTPDLTVASGARIEGTLHMTEGSSADWLSLREVADYLEVERSLAEQWVKEGRLTGGVQEAGQWRFRKSEIDEWIATQKSS